MKKIESSEINRRHRKKKTERELWTQNKEKKKQKNITKQNKSNRNFETFSDGFKSRVEITEVIVIVLLD